MPTSRSPFARPRWNEADARAVIAALERSGQPVAVFAASHGLDPQRVYLWRRRLAEGEDTTFREVVVGPSSAAQATNEPFEVVLASGSIVRVPPCFDADALARLLHVLSQV